MSRRKIEWLLIVADVSFHEHIVRHVLYVLQVSQVTCIRQLVKIYYSVLRIFVHEQAHYMAA